MAGQHRRWLKESLESRLMPELNRRGFEPVPPAPGETRGEIGRGFPFGTIRRKGSRGYELVEIQLDGYSPPAFRLNLGVVPPGGFEHEVTGWIAEDDARVHYLRVFYEMYEVAWRAKWFAVRHPPWSQTEATKSDYDALVLKAVGHLHEIDDLFSKGKVGKHIRKRG